ncbi:MAG: hypothetical protein ACREIQ_04390 [Nitrospiria bacterium]
MRLTHHETVVLKEYMQDLIEQARQETLGHTSAKYLQKSYTYDDALMDLLAILDDRVESEGAQMGLSDGFPHQMWDICNEAREQARNAVWFSSNLGQTPLTKIQVRETVYQVLLKYMDEKFKGKNGG